MVEIVSGHKVTNCDGKWIDVGTLLNPRDQMCSICRGHRQKPLVEDEERMQDDGYIDDFRVTRTTRHGQETEYDIEDYGDASPPPKYSHGMQMLGYILVAAAVSAGVTLTVLWAYTS
jgi:hypothetical protein